MTKNQNIRCTLVAVFAALSVLISSIDAAQPPTHPGAEKALSNIVFENDFDDGLELHSRQVVTVLQNDKVPGLNGLMFIKWKGDDADTFVMASVQWFEKKEDLLAFYAQSLKQKDHKLGKFNETTLWSMLDENGQEIGHAWTDGEHLLVTLGGSPSPSPKMVETWLAQIPSKVAEIERKKKRKTEKF